MFSLSTWKKRKSGLSGASGPEWSDRRSREASPDGREGFRYHAWNPEWAISLSRTSISNVLSEPMGKLPSGST